MDPQNSIYRQDGDEASKTLKPSKRLNGWKWVAMFLAVGWVFSAFYFFWAEQEFRERLQTLFEGLNFLVAAFTLVLVVVGIRYQQHEMEELKKAGTAQKEEQDKQRQERLVEQIRQRRKAWPVLTLDASTQHPFLTDEGFEIPVREFTLSNLGPMIVDVQLVDDREVHTPYSAERNAFDLGTGETHRLEVQEQPEEDEWYKINVTFTTQEGDEGSVEFVFENHRLESRQNKFPWNQSSR